MPEGVLYGALGNQTYLFGTTYSILTLRHTEYTGPITIVTDFDHEAHNYLNNIGVEIIIIEKTDEGYIYGCKSKPSICMLSPYDKTVFLDSDVIALKPIHSIWRFLNKNMLVASKGPHHSIGQMIKTGYSREEINWSINVCSKNTAVHNTGMFLWKRNEPTKKFMNIWNTEAYRFDGLDELAFSRAAHIAGVKKRIISDDYNWVYGKEKDNTIILHMTGALQGKTVSDLKGLTYYKHYYPDIFNKCLDIFKIKIPSEWFKDKPGVYQPQWIVK